MQKLIECTRLKSTVNPLNNYVSNPHFNRLSAFKIPSTNRLPSIFPQNPNFQQFDKTNMIPVVIAYFPVQNNQMFPQ